MLKDEIDILDNEILGSIHSSQLLRSTYQHIKTKLLERSLMKAIQFQIIPEDENLNPAKIFVLFDDGSIWSKNVGEASGVWSKVAMPEIATRGNELAYSEA